VVDCDLSIVDQVPDRPSAIVVPTGAVKFDLDYIFLFSDNYLNCNRWNCNELWSWSKVFVLIFPVFRFVIILNFSTTYIWRVILLQWRVIKKRNQFNEAGENMFFAFLMFTPKILFQICLFWCTKELFYFIIFWFKYMFIHLGNKQEICYE